MSAAEILSIDISVKEGYAPYTKVFGTCPHFVILRIGLSAEELSFPCIHFTFKDPKDLIKLQENLSTAVTEFLKEEEAKANDPSKDTV